MTQAEYGPVLDPLALGLTRPPMLMGVSIRYFFANVMLCALVFIHARTLLSIPLFIVLHLWMVSLSVKEPNFIKLWLMAFLKTPPSLNFTYWGKTNSYDAW